LLDESLSFGARMQIFLEVFGNIFLKVQTSEYLQKRALLFSSFLQDSAGDNEEGKTLSTLLDLSQLKFKSVLIS
jgi:hypothetical protein